MWGGGPPVTHGLPVKSERSSAEPHRPPQQQPTYSHPGMEQQSRDQERKVRNKYWFAKSQQSKTAIRHSDRMQENETKQHEAMLMTRFLCNFKISPALF
jgi:hypothetical protein